MYFPEARETSTKSIQLGIVSNAQNSSLRRIRQARFAPEEFRFYRPEKATRSRCHIDFSKLGTSETQQMLEWLLTLAEEDYI
jgi:hypothetical protein